MFNCKEATMKCPPHRVTVAFSTDKSSAGNSMVSHLKACPVPSPIKPHYPPVAALTVLPLDTSSTVHDKENSASRNYDGSLDEGFEDSGYLSLHNSQMDEPHGDGEDEHTRGKTVNVLQSTAATKTPKNSPSKCEAHANCSHPVPLADSPVSLCRRRPPTFSLSSTPSDHLNSTLPILKFQKAVCEELTESYRKNKKYDWSIVTKVAEDHLLDRVIGSHMGCEFVDMFSSLLSRNMRNLLSSILALLGDMDLISCKKVSRTWRKIICDDAAALNRCQKAEQVLKESKNSLRQPDCWLTRDVAESRMVLSCIQTLASSSTPSSSSSFRVNRRTTASPKNGTPTSQCTRFGDYIKAASSLKQHESLRPCKRCGSPAKHSAEAQRAMCTRLSCLFDFCTRCQESFHGSTPCRAVQPRSHFPTSKSTPHVPGSARSKRNIRRL